MRVATHADWGAKFLELFDRPHQDGEPEIS